MIKTELANLLPTEDGGLWETVAAASASGFGSEFESESGSVAVVAVGACLGAVGKASSSIECLQLICVCVLVFLEFN